MSLLDAAKAQPDSFVALIPVPWDLTAGDLLSQVHAETWAEYVDYVVEPAPEAGDDIYGHGEIRFQDGALTANIVVEASIEHLAELSGTSREPFTETEVILLKEHQAIWRVTLKGARGRGLEIANRFGRVLSTFIEAGAAGVFLPFNLQLHSPRFIKHQAMDLGQLPSLVNLFTSAWNEGDWMMTRGLTVFGLPELETSTHDGLNAAYFRLMDVASAMIAQGDAFTVGARLQLGPKMYQIGAGPAGPQDVKVPVCGAFGVLTINEAV